MTHPANISEELKLCVDFHGHICPGLIYGYIVATESISRLSITRAADEEIVAVSENDSCSVDALQVLLGTTLGKGNLILKDYGKNVYTVFNRKTSKAIRFSRKKEYEYTDKHLSEFNDLEKKMTQGTATDQEKKRQKYLKTMDLLQKPALDVFEIVETKAEEPAYARLAPSVACASCFEMTMKTKMEKGDNNDLYCRPCYDELA